MSEEETTKKAKGIIEEFHSLYDYKEVAECIKELKEKNAKLDIVLKYWLTDLLEGKKRSVDKLGSSSRSSSRLGCLPRMTSTRGWCKSSIH